MALDIQLGSFELYYIELCMCIVYVYTQLFWEPRPGSRGACPLAGFGTESRGLALALNPLGRRSQRKGRRTTSGGLQRQREAVIRAAPSAPSRSQQQDSES